MSFQYVKHGLIQYLLIGNFCSSQIFLGIILYDDVVGWFFVCLSGDVHVYL